MLAMGFGQPAAVAATRRGADDHRWRIKQFTGYAVWRQLATWVVG